MGFLIRRKATTPKGRGRGGGRLFNDALYWRDPVNIASFPRARAARVEGVLGTNVHLHFFPITTYT